MLVRWWRQQSDVDRALLVEPPVDAPYGTTLWRLERARAAMSGGQDDVAVAECDRALAEARAGQFGELELYAHLIRGAVDPPSAEIWAKVLETAANTLNTETYLGALEMDARRLTLLGEHDTARKRWRALAARSEELGYRPGMEESFFWLSSGELTYTGVTRG